MSRTIDDYEDEELVTFEANLVYESTDAYCVMIEEDSFSQEAARYWLPKTQTKYVEDSTRSIRGGEFTIPEWLASNKGIDV